MNATPAKRGLLHDANGKSFILPFVLVTSLFFFWGVANNMTDTLLAAFKKIMSMSDFQTSLIQLSFYGSYFCFALPAALFIRKKSYKAGILLGIILYAAGCFLFYPASVTANYYHYLIAIYILAGGCSILETSANPYIIAMGNPETGTRRLNLAQSFNPMGSITGILLSQAFILGELNSANAAERAGMNADSLHKIQASELIAVTMTYVGVGLVLLLIFFLILRAKMPAASDPDNGKLAPVFKRLLANKNYVRGVVAQFFYVGAQIGVWSYTIRYIMNNLQLNEADAASWYLASLLLFSVARFIFTGLMKFIKPGLLLIISSVLAIAACSGTILLGGVAGSVSLVAISFFMSLMFPTIYGLGVEGLGEDAKIGGSGMIMAILGGAVLTAVQGYISDMSSISSAFYVPLICFVVIMLFGFSTLKRAKALTA
ncbi:MAG: L-fucose:H+ symporter permease [Bacteroidales bacterium]